MKKILHLLVASFIFTMPHSSQGATLTKKGSIDDITEVIILIDEHILVDGSYVYLNGGEGLKIFDVSNPEFPSLVSTYTPLDIESITLSNNYLYTTAINKVIQVLNVSDPKKPTWVGSSEEENMPYTSGNVVSDGNYLYIPDAAVGSFLIYKISDPHKPVEVSKTELRDNLYGLAVSGDYVYLASGSEGVLIYSIIDPSHPLQVGRYDTSSYTRDVFVKGNYAYVADYENGLQILDISKPSAPSLVGSFIPDETLFGLYGDIVVDGNYAYIDAGPAGAVHIIDVSDPKNPTLILDENHDLLSSITSFAVSKNYMYVAYTSATEETLAILYFDPNTTESAASSDIESSAQSASETGDDIKSTGGCSLRF